MIRRLRRKEIDFQKYQHCVEHSIQKNFYAQKEILDFLSDGWELLVYGDYEFVMPVPVKKKVGISVVVMPLFCQQLGIFSRITDAKIEREFCDFLIDHYKILSYAFNHHNLAGENFERKKNYVIEKTEYQLLRKNYFKGRKSTVKTAQYLSSKELQLEAVLDFIKNNFKGLDKKQDSEKFFAYLQFLKTRNELKLYGSFKETALTNVAILINTKDQMSLLGLINHEEFKADNGASYLIDKILQDHIHQKSFDFMGGSIRGIEVFFKSFGSSCEEYPMLLQSKKELIKNIFRK